MADHSICAAEKVDFNIVWSYVSVGVGIAVKFSANSQSQPLNSSSAGGARSKPTNLHRPRDMLAPTTTGRL